jgi:hypothetical protein
MFEDVTFAEILARASLDLELTLELLQYGRCKNSATESQIVRYSDKPPIEVSSA